MVAAIAGGAAPVLVTLNPVPNTLGLLEGLGGGRFANPITLPTISPDSSAVTGDFNGDGVPDLAVLGPGGLFVYLGNGRGGFAAPTPYEVASDSTGLSVADVNLDGIPDLVVGNPFGDVLVLQGKGDGKFLPFVGANRDVLLAVLNTRDGGGTQFVYADQSLDAIVVKRNGVSEPTVLANRASGLLQPGAAVLADLNGDGIPDLIVANSGRNSVLVYPGLPGGGFGPELNGGRGFTVGTDPVGITVYNLNGRPDLIVADEGSNDVTILLNEPAGSSFTFVRGSRLNVGAGPVSTAIFSTSAGAVGLLVSDSVSKDLRILPSRGNGFFDDSHPTIIPLAASPGQVVPINVGAGPSVAVLLPDLDLVALITELSGGSPEVSTFSSGGLDPVSELAVQAADGTEYLVVANDGDGHVSLLGGGPDGLALLGVEMGADLPNPTSLALASIVGNSLSVYAVSEGQENAVLLTFLATPTISGLTLLTSDEVALPLIATLLTVRLEPPEVTEGPSGKSGGERPFPRSRSVLLDDRSRRRWGRGREPGRGRTPARGAGRRRRPGTFSVDPLRPRPPGGVRSDPPRVPGTPADR